MEIFLKKKNNMPKKCLSEKIVLDEKKMTEIKLDEKKLIITTK